MSTSKDRYYIIETSSLARMSGIGGFTKHEAEAEMKRLIEDGENISSFTVLRGIEVEYSTEVIKVVISE